MAKTELDRSLVFSNKRGKEREEKRENVSRKPVLKAMAKQGTKCTVLFG